MQAHKTYEYLVKARGRILDWARPLSAEQYAQQFPMGLGSLGATLTHILASEWYYVERMEGRSVPRYVEWPIRHEEPPRFAELEAAWAEKRR